MSDHYDVIVIGSGAGGGTVAHALAPTGKRILLLERGGFLPREPQNWDPAAVWRDSRYRNSGQWLDLDTGQRFTPKQHYYVGGNTKVYGAILFRMRERDFGAVQHVDGVSPAWPISYSDLEPYYTRAERLYQVHGVRGVDPTDPPSKAPYPHPPISHEPRIEQLRADLVAAGMHPFELPNGILLDEAAPHRSACVRCSTCDGFPCLVNGKADAQTICVEPALQQPNVTLLTDAYVSRLETGPSGRFVERVVVQRNGQREEYRADVVVLAAGAINSAALLLRSAAPRHPHGLGNSSGVVGRHLMMHNNSSLIAFSKVENPTRFQKTLALHDWYLGSDDWDYPMGGIQMLGKSDAEQIRANAPHWAGAVSPGMPFEVLAHHAVDLWLCGEDLPRPENRVTLENDGQIRLTLDEKNNVEGLKRLRHELQRRLSDLGMHEKHLLSHSIYMHKGMPIGATAHQAGTIRFGTDPASSALDVNCRAHELDNLYVVDTSFFPSIGAVNPSLTAIANALRVGDHVLERLG